MTATTAFRFSPAPALRAATRLASSSASLTLFSFASSCFCKISISSDDESRTIGILDEPVDGSCSDKAIARSSSSCSAWESVSIIGHIGLFRTRGSLEEDIGQVHRRVQAGQAFAGTTTKDSLQRCMLFFRERSGYGLPARYVLSESALASFGPARCLVRAQHRIPWRSRRWCR